MKHPSPTPNENIQEDGLYGVHPVEEALKTQVRRIDKILVESTRRDSHRRLLETAAGLGVKVQFVPRETLDRHFPNRNHQGIAAMMSPYDYADFDKLLDAAEKKGHRVVVLLDGVSDPQNLGAVLRSAGAFGADFVVLPKDRAAPLTAAVARVAAGAAEHVPVARVTNLVRAIERLKEEGFWIYALEAAGEIFLHQQKLTGDVALILGSEGKGTRRLVREKADVVCRIPADGPIGSLNVAGAAAIALYEVFRQRKS